MFAWIAYIETKSLGPSVCDRDKSRIEGSAQLLHERWQRIRVVLVLASPKSMAPHNDTTAIVLVVIVKFDDGPALGRCEQPRQERIASRV
jgi:hypothetical protein